MSDYEKNEHPKVDDIEIEPLSDTDLESVAGGALADCSCSTTTGNCTGSSTPVDTVE